MTATTWINGTGGLVLTESHTSNAATFTLTPADGLDYQLSFFDGSSCIVPAAGISLTIPSSATIGTDSGYACRLWFAIFNNAGAPALAVRKCLALSTFSIKNPVEFLVNSTTAITSGSNSTHTFYSTIAVTSQPWMWVSFATYESGLATAGTWNVSPTTISAVTQSTPRPGAVIQTVVSASSVFDTFNAGAGVGINAALYVQITPQSAAHLFETGVGQGQLYLRTGVGGANAIIYLRRTSPTAYILSSTQGYEASATDVLMPYSLHGYDAPNTASIVSYQQEYYNVSGGLIQGTASEAWVKEIMT